MWWVGIILLVPGSGRRFYITGRDGSDNGLFTYLVPRDLSEYSWPWKLTARSGVKSTRLILPVDTFMPSRAEGRNIAQEIRTLGVWAWRTERVSLCVRQPRPNWDFSERCCPDLPTFSLPAHYCNMQLHTPHRGSASGPSSWDYRRLEPCKGKATWWQCRRNAVGVWSSACALCKPSPAYCGGSNVLHSVPFAKQC